MNVPVGGPITIVQEASPAGPVPGVFALYAWLALPDSTTVTPHPRGLGLACFATPLAGAAPLPDVTWNNTGKSALGDPDFVSFPAPHGVVDLPAGVGSPVTFTLQGFLAYLCSVADRPGSITNAVTVVVK